jgi:hypothetical protein
LTAVGSARRLGSAMVERVAETPVRRPTLFSVNTGRACRVKALT